MFIARYASGRALQLAGNDSPSQSRRDLDPRDCAARSEMEIDVDPDRSYDVAAPLG